MGKFQLIAGPLVLVANSSRQMDIILLNRWWLPGKRRTQNKRHNRESLKRSDFEGIPTW